MLKPIRVLTLLSLPLLGFSLACSDAPARVEPMPPVVMMPAQAGAPAMMPTEQPTEPKPRARSAECIAPSAISNPPRTVEEAITLINSLPKPLTLPCFLQSLARPLAISATNSVFSLQPADGVRSPRIFLFTPGMVMSVVPSGPGAAFLEFGENRAENRSLKAEIVFPVLTQIASGAAFDHLMFGEQSTTCSVCHADQEEEPNASGVRQFVSRALRPFIQDKIPLAGLAQELAICDAAREPDRCAMLDGLLGWGPVVERDFDQSIPTFGG